MEPVKNKLCGHTYSRKAAISHIQRMREKAKCPVAGCKHSISLVDLEENNVVAFEIRQKKKK